MAEQPKITLHWCAFALSVATNARAASLTDRHNCQAQWLPSQLYTLASGGASNLVRCPSVPSAVQHACTS